MLACRRTMPGPDATHEQHAHAVIVFQVMDVGLETCSVGNANAAFCASFEVYPHAISFIAVRIDHAQLSGSGCRRVVGRSPCRFLSPSPRTRTLGCAATIVVTCDRGRRRLTMTFSGLRRQRDEHPEGDKCSDLHALLLDEADTHSVTLTVAHRINAARFEARGCTRNMTTSFTWISCARNSGSALRNHPDREPINQGQTTRGQPRL